MKKISKVATASVLLFTLANPLAVFAENKVGNISETSSNKTTQDLTITSEEVNGDIVFHVTAQRDTYEAIIYARINGKDYTYNLGNLKKGQVSKIVQPDVSINNNNASISKESNKGRSLPNTSAVRELVQKTVLYNNEINGNVIEAKVVYKVYELVEKNSTQKNEKPEASEPKAPKAEEPVSPAPKAEEPVRPAPKAEEPVAPAPKVEKPAASTPKAEEPAAPALKAEEPAAPEPKAEEPVSPAPKAEEPAASVAPKVEKPAEPAPKAEEPAATPKEDTPSEEVAPKDEKLEEAKKDGKDVIEKIAASKLSEIEKVKDEAEKAKLKAKLKELKEAGLEAINNAENHDAAVEATDEYQTKIDEINVPGEELPAPNYNKENLTNGRNEGTTIDNGSTAIGHGSGEATSTTLTQPTTEERPTSPVTPTQPASTSVGTSSFRNAPEVQVRARRVGRAANQPDGTVNISYNYDGMPDINGFLSDPGENNTVAISNSATEDEVKELVKAKIQAKAQELAKHGYKVKEEIVFEQDTNVKNFNYVVTFTKEKTGTTGFRNAPEVQVRTKKVVKRDLSNKTKKINIYYNLTALKDIAGALGELGGENMLTFPGNTPKEELKRAIEEKTKAQIEKLKKQGFKVVSTTDLDQIVEGGDSYDYVVEFTKESKSASANNTGFRKAPLIQKRSKRSVEQKEKVDVHIYFNLKTLPGIAGALDVDGDTTIQLPKDASKEQVKEAIKDKIAKVENRGYKVSDFYFGAKMEHGYDFVVEFKK